MPPWDPWDTETFSSVNALQTFSQVIVVAVTIVAVVAVVAARVSTPPAMAVASTAASVVVVFIFAPVLPPATAVLRRRPVAIASWLPSRCQRIAVAPSIAVAVVSPSRRPLPLSLVDYCIFPHGACCSHDDKGWLRSRSDEDKKNRRILRWSRAGLHGHQ